MQKVVVYFEKPGKENTQACVEAAKAAVKESGYRHVVVASTTGSTGLQFAEALKTEGLNLIVVTHSSGFKGPNTFEIPPGTLDAIRAHGAKIFTGTILTHSIETALYSKFNGVYPAMIVAQALRRFGEGAKVCCEIVMMAVDAGLIPEEEEVLAVAGTGYGADTVAVIRSAASKRFLDLRVLEFLAKPRV